jgi:lipid II:glycine glycyltransferase (peptidoglycan interpeptide bridge formation enzyme)
MQIREIKDQSVWDDFVEKLNLNTFLHSHGWMEFNKKQGYKTWQLGLFDENNVLKAVSLIIKVDAKRGTFLFCPHGPQSITFKDSKDSKLKTAELDLFVGFLRQLAKKEKCSFIRIQPIVDKNPENAEIFVNAGFRTAPIHMHTELSSVLDIDRPIDEILLGMRKTTRQMVKKAVSLVEKKEVIVEYHTKIDDSLYEVYKATGDRGNFVIYSQEYLQNEFDSFYSSGNAVLYSISYKGKILSWGMVIFSGSRAFYHQGANILNKDIPASYLCQWTGINKAIEKGCKTYDFWGVAPAEAKNHPWARISLFKRGFGGSDTELLHAQDLVLDWKYWIAWAIEKNRARKRGFN